MILVNKKREEEKKVWVEVEVNKYTDGITVFRGKMLLSDVDAWASGELVDCALKLEKTYWYHDNNICMLGCGEGNARQYTGDTYIRVDTIMLLFVLKDESYPNGNAVGLEDNIYHFPGRP